MLAFNMNLSLEGLLDRLRKASGQLYYYVVDSVDEGDDAFVQRGSGPNWQGDLVTLCTCKHKMRTYLSVEEWPGIWIAGVTGTDNTHDGNHYLVFLVRVYRAFQSHRDLWRWLSDTERRAKRAKGNRHGDVYKPMGWLTKEWNHLHYERPDKDHEHCLNGEWAEDIFYTRGPGTPALLVGQRTMSFLWNEPIIHAKVDLKQGERKTTLGSFLPRLRAYSR
jgi:hypothetical protein